MFKVDFYYFDNESVQVFVPPEQFALFQQALAKGTIFFNMADGKAFWTDLNKIRYLTIENEMDDKNSRDHDAQATNQQPAQDEQEASAGASQVDN